ncbi:LysR family transcriptional regulator [Streptomyces boncukensis]|uniref:LysR family transcriptional regulator n=1 Tax=Streptomyces boncukensis TaxID=2711219 RepID=A0A6G4WVD1_9ACTN|nr:LysR family transcriptional regulator [Streptomyces boncukensis]NGO68494.1 LysR family transcriptional regulator [Streptomyces boncukensis]
MELQQLRYVIAVAETGGFTRAAERCLIVQSALSHQIAKLEKELGARLFERTSRRVRLTAAGRAFLPAARQALDATERARAEVAAVTGEIRGDLMLGAIPTITAVDLPGIIRAYYDRYPQVRIQLFGGRSEHLAEQVRDGRLDLALIGALRHSVTKGVHEYLLAEDEHVAVLPPDHRLADAGKTDLRRLAEEVFVDFAAGTAARAQTEEAFDAAGLQRHVAFEVSTVDFIASFIRNGLGIALLPNAFVQQLSGVTVLRVHDAPAREQRLIWSVSQPSPAAAAFLRELGVSPDGG